MEEIKGITFAPFASRGIISKKEARKSLEQMIQRTNVNFVILVPNGVQDTPQSEKIDYTSMVTMSDDEIKETLHYLHDMGIRTALKPTVNCRNGTWRAHISFFDEDVPCEPKWRNWFHSYEEFQMHFANVAQECGCEMFIAGCEMVQSEHREAEWRHVMEQLRTVYSGLLSYNTDKYQEHNVKWWDAVDVISSSGYYPAGDWDKQLDRIEKVVLKADKPFFFAECGCKSIQGSSKVPNDWSLKGAIDVNEQAEWFRQMFTACAKRDWIKGFAIWEWGWNLYAPNKAGEDGSYWIYQKPAEKIIADFFK